MSVVEFGKSLVVSVVEFGKSLVVSVVNPGTSLVVSVVFSCVIKLKDPGTNA